MLSGFSIEGPSQAKIECNDNGDGSADVRYYPTVQGEYSLHILCNNEDIPGSPYIANILPNTDYYPELVSGISLKCVWNIDRLEKVATFFDGRNGN